MHFCKPLPYYYNSKLNLMQNLQEGSLLQHGKYRIERVLGQGGFGITYLAENTMLEGMVAIKEFFFDGYCERDEQTSEVTVPTSGMRDFVERFKLKFVKEARTIFRLSHPNIVRILDIFEENGTAYYVMEHIDGQSLDDLVKHRGALPEEEALGYIRQAAAALNYIHGERINHLDVKPNNLMLRAKDSRILLIDFGVAKQYDSVTYKGTTTTPVGISHGYSPTEQYRKNGVQTFSPSSDVYALAATLFKLLTGTTPPESLEVQEDGLPVDELRVHGVSPTVISAIILAMKSRTERTQSISEFAAQLEGRAPSFIVEELTTEIPNAPNAEPTVVVNPDGDRKAREEAERRAREEAERKAHEEAERRARKEADRKAREEAERRAREEADRKAREEADRKAREEADRKAREEAERNAQNAHNAAPSKKPSVASANNNLWKWIGIGCVGIALIVAGIVANSNRASESTEPSGPTYPTETIRATYTANVLTVGDVTYTMVPVEGGTFTMGATSEQGSDADNAEKPTHEVTLSSFSIGKTEVTQALWEAVMGSNPSEFKGANKPVENVSWKDCQTFIAKLDSLTGLPFRLPTEAEWEYAARGGQKSQGYKYSGSNDVGEVAWYDGNSNSSTHDVAQKRPNELGLCDMSGNVWEWCSDWYGNYSSSNQTNPQGPNSGQRRVLRGGGWYGFARCCRSSFRGYDVPDRRCINHGLRLVLSE